ncbi:MAG: hypothetical protein K2O24_00835 [Muribaculaceae bacterium]|nr:hypothetical protein [Muribaculaceae bacterium]
MQAQINNIPPRLWASDKMEPVILTDLQHVCIDVSMEMPESKPVCLLYAVFRAVDGKIEPGFLGDLVQGFMDWQICSMKQNFIAPRKLTVSVLNLYDETLLDSKSTLVFPHRRGAGTPAPESFYGVPLLSREAVFVRVPRQGETLEVPMSFFAGNWQSYRLTAKVTGAAMNTAGDCDFFLFDFVLPPVSCGVSSRAQTVEIDIAAMLEHVQGDVLGFDATFTLELRDNDGEIASRSWFSVCGRRFADPVDLRFVNCFGVEELLTLDVSKTTSLDFKSSTAVIAGSPRNVDASTARVIRLEGVPRRGDVEALRQCSMRLISVEGSRGAVRSFDLSDADGAPRLSMEIELQN